MEKKAVLGIHSLKRPFGARKKKKLLGRGSSSGHGKTSTRGSKGETSRSGRATYPGFEGGQSPLIRRFAKRGFTSKFPTVYQIVNLTTLAGMKIKEITPAVLWEKGVVKSRSKLVKILGEGELTSACSIKAHAFSKSAEEKIKKAGGTIEVIHA